jgi:hypothetical protein
MSLPTILPIQLLQAVKSSVQSFVSICGLHELPSFRNPTDAKVYFVAVIYHSNRKEGLPKGTTAHT